MPFADQFVSCLNAFNVDARAVEKTGDGLIEPQIINAAGKKVPATVINNNDGTYKVTYVLPEEGMITYNDRPFTDDYQANTSSTSSTTALPFRAPLRSK